MILKIDNNFENGSQRKLGILDIEFNNNNKVLAKTTRDYGLKLGKIYVDIFLEKEAVLSMIHFPNDYLLTISSNK